MQPDVQSTQRQSPLPCDLGPKGVWVGHQPLKDLTLPPELQQHVEDSCRRRGFWWQRNRRGVEEDVKLQYFYGGYTVAYRRSADGLVVVLAGRLSSPEFGEAWESFRREEQRDLILDSPSVWGADDSAIGVVEA